MKFLCRGKKKTLQKIWISRINEFQLFERQRGRQREGDFLAVFCSADCPHRGEGAGWGPHSHWASPMAGHLPRCASAESWNGSGVGTSAHLVWNANCRHPQAMS